MEGREEMTRQVVGANSQETALHLIDKADWMARLAKCWRPYGRIAWHALRKGVPLMDLVRTQWSLRRTCPQRPALATVELTNFGDLKLACDTDLAGRRRRGFMGEETFNTLLAGLRELGVSWVRLAGGGEPTLHPQFAAIARDLSRMFPYVSVRTSAQWTQEKRVIGELLQAPVDLIEVGVEAGHRPQYEGGQKGGDFARLKCNLALLRLERDLQGADILINIRLRLRPSNVAKERAWRGYWRPFADMVTPDLVIQSPGPQKERDAFLPVQRERGDCPCCILPYKEVVVYWNGDVPVCSLAVQQAASPGLLVGNIGGQSLPALWNGPLMRQYRGGHRGGDPGEMPRCRGCGGGGAE